MHIISPIPNLKILYLADNSKAPDGKRFPRGHLDAIPAPEYITENYGIALDNQWIVVDIDDPSACDRKFPRTWTQITKKGEHMLYKAPPGFNGQNRKLVNAQGKIYGDLKCKGYIVGPGSTIAGHTYVMKYDEDQIPVPVDLTRLMERAEIIEQGSEQSGIPSGMHGDFLAQQAGWLRGRYGLSEEAIVKALARGPLSILQDVDPERPFTLEHIKSVAHSIAKKEATTGSNLALSPAGWESYTEIDTSMPLNEWWMYRFIPKGELVMLYGKGGIGKSSFASYLASEVIKSGKTIGFAGIEEPFLRFATRAALAYPEGTETTLNGLINIGSQWQFPRDAEALRSALLTHPLDVLYFDSIYGHFEAVEGLNTAERARHCLAPLASIAQELGTTVVATFHENKVGQFLGSVEMVNVARIVLHATRAKDKPLKLEVVKTNFTEPDHKLSFGGSLIPGRSRSGEPWEEVGENGDVIPLELFVINERWKSTGEDEDDEPEEDTRWEQVKDLLSQGKSVRDISTVTLIPKSTVQDLIKKQGKLVKPTVTSIDMNTIK